MVECSVGSFIHRDFRLMYLHLPTDCFTKVFFFFFFGGGGGVSV